MEEAESEARLTTLSRAGLWAPLVAAARAHALTYRSTHALAAAAAALTAAAATLPEVQAEALQLAERAHSAEPTEARAIVLTSCLLRALRFPDALRLWARDPGPAAARQRARVLSDWGTHVKAAHAHPAAPTCLAAAAAAASSASAALLAASETAPCALAEAALKYRAAVAACEAYAPAHFNLGVALAEAGAYADARAAYDAALRHDPALVDAHVNLGALARLTGRLADAAEHYAAALALAPGLPLALASLAITLTDLGTAHKNAARMRDALQCYQRALRLRADYAPAWYNLGVAYAEKGRVDKAVAAYHACLLLHPACYEAHNNLGVLYKDALDDAPRALAHYHAALALQPHYPQTLNNLGVLYTLLGRMDDARHALDAAQAASGGRYAEAWNNLGVLARDEGDMALALSAYDAALAADARHANAAQNRLLALNYVPLAPALVYDQHRAWGAALEQAATPLPPVPRPPAPAATLRVGLLSPDLCLHSVSYFLEALLRHAPRPALHITCFAASARADLRTAQLRALADAWVSVVGLSAERAALAVREQRIDVLLELAGHTAGNRLDVCALRPAPVQGTYLGYPNTTGLSRIDFRLTDAAADPPAAEQRHSERLVRLDGCFLCYTPYPAPCPVPVAPLPALTAGFVTFGCFNTLAKLSAPCLRTWAALLAAVPNSRLLLKSKALASPRVAERFRHALQVPAHRLVCLPLAAAPAEHLATYGAVDVALDTFPYAGTTTTCEALLMGVPLVTLTGPAHAHNVSASLLRAVGLPAGQFVAASEADYVRLAAALAADLPALAALRARLRAQMLASPLCDGPAFAAKLERALRQQYALWHAADT